MGNCMDNVYDQTRYIKKGTIVITAKGKQFIVARTLQKGFFKKITKIAILKDIGDNGHIQTHHLYTRDGFYLEYSYSFDVLYVGKKVYEENQRVLPEYSNEYIQYVKN